MTRFCATSHEQARHLDASTPEYGMNGAFRSRPSWGYTELLCYRLSCTAARLGLATGGTSRNWTSSPCTTFAKFSMSAGKDYVPNPGDPSQGWAHWHWSHVEPGTASLVRTCQSHGRQQTPKTTVPCWALNWKTAQRWAEEAVQRWCWNLPSRPTTSQLTSGKPWPRTGRPGVQLYARAQSTLREADYRAWMIRDRPGRTEWQTQALLYLVSSTARSALPLSGSKLICANTSTDASSSKSKDYYYLYMTTLQARINRTRT